MNITLNVSGQIFEVNVNTLLKIPYFSYMLDACQYEVNEIIFINRPSHIFKHVLAFVIDPLYPYPEKYAFELDFYGILYDKEKLYNKHQDLTNEINKIKKLVMCKCCESSRMLRSLFCTRHNCCLITLENIDICGYFPSSSNYCEFHAPMGKYCVIGGCDNLRSDRYYCQYHSPKN